MLFDPAMKRFKILLFCAAISALPTAAWSDTVVKVLHIQSNAAIRAIWQEAAQKFESAHPGVKIQWDYLENEAFKAKLPTLLQSKDRPNMFHSWGGGVMEEQISSGICQDITSQVSADGFKETFAPAALQNFTVDGKIYGVPNDLGPIVFWYNKALCEKAGVDPTKIQTWDDFLDAVKKCKAAGITPVAVGGKDKWTIHLYTTYLIMRVLGKEETDAVYADKDGGFANPGVVKAFQLFQDLASLQPFQSGYLANSYSESAGTFHDGKAAFHLMGNWDLVEGRSAAVDKKGLSDDQLGWILFPEVKGGKGKSTDLTGSVDGWLVTKDSPKEAVEFLKVWQDKETQTKLASAGLFISAVKGTADAIQDPLLKGIAQAIDKSEWFGLAMNVLTGPDTGLVFEDVCADLASGKTTPEKAAKEIEESWQKNKPQ